MLSKTESLHITGLTCSKITIEVDVVRGMPAFAIVGLADTAVQEARERVKSSIRNSGYAFPTKKIIVNLAPAGMKKQSSSFDLPMAVGILKASDQIPSLPEKTVLLGELSLDGGVRHVRGVLTMALFAKDAGYKKIIVPKENLLEASLVKGIEVYGVETLAEAIAAVEGQGSLFQATEEEVFGSMEIHPPVNVDISQVQGQFHAKRALEIAAAGGHNIILNGPPGSGKSMLAKALQGILPPMSIEEAIEVSEIYSVSGLLPKGKALVEQRPFRTVHHTASSVSIVGGGRIPRPGEVSLAHRGVLFLDELLEFPKEVLEVLRQPLEDRSISVSRALGTESYPASVMLVGAMNPCPCGFLTDKERECVCNERTVEKYQKKLSGPLLDRVDMYVEVPRVDIDKMQQNAVKSASSEEVRQRVVAAREIQRSRFQGKQVYMNSEMSNQDIEEFVCLDKEVEEFAMIAAKKLKLTARSYFRLLRLACTIADLDSSNQVKKEHVSEALQYRRRE